MDRRGSDVLVKSILQYRKWIALAVVVVVAALLFSHIVIPTLVILILATIATFSTSYKRVIRIPPAVELVTITTILVSVAYGPVIGAIYGAVVTLTSELMTNALDVFIVSFVPARAIIGLVAPLAYGVWDGNMVLTILTLSIVYNAISQPLYVFVSDAEMRVKSLYFVFMNIGTNFIFAVSIIPPIANLLLA